MKVLLIKLLLIVYAFFDSHYLKQFLKFAFFVNYINFILFQHKEFKIKSLLHIWKLKL